MTTQQRAVFPLKVSDLIASGTFADRFAYASYFVPVQITFKDDVNTPALTFTQKQWVARFAAKAEDGVVAEWLNTLGYPSLLASNKVPTWSAASVDLGDGAPSGPSASPQQSSEVVSDLQSISRLVASSLPSRSKPLSDLLAQKVNELTAHAMQTASAGPSSPQALIAPRVGVVPHPTAVTGPSIEDGKNVLLGLIQSEVGYLFLDRTRIRPKGFTVGEHVYSISLSPAEEVTLEQKSYSKRSVTMEEADETEQTLDLELASTLTTEIDESMDRTRALTDKWGLSASHTGSYKSPEFFWGSINASHTIGYTKDVTSASTETARRSLKDTQTSSSKVSAKYRSSHKTTFSVKTESGFEVSSRRVIRNQNRFTPVDYHFFKILRVVSVSHERYGALLCWAPFVKSPATLRRPSWQTLKRPYRWSPSRRRHPPTPRQSPSAFGRSKSRRTSGEAPATCQPTMMSAFPFRKAGNGRTRQPT